MNNQDSKWRVLYDHIKGDYNLPKYDEFYDYMNRPGDEGYQNRLRLFNLVKDEYDVGDTYEEFKGYMGLAPVHPAQPQPQQPQPQTQAPQPQTQQPMQQPQRPASAQPQTAQQRPASAQPQTARQPISHSPLAVLPPGQGQRPGQGPTTDWTQVDTTAKRAPSYPTQAEAMASADIAVKERKAKEAEAQRKAQIEQPIVAAAGKAWQSAYKSTEQSAQRNRQALTGNSPVMDPNIAQYATFTNEVERMKNFDLDRLMLDTWDNLGEAGQRQLVNTHFDKLKADNPGADEGALYQQAQEDAFRQSNQVLFDYAVKQNMPKGRLDFLAKKIQDANLLNTVQKGLQRSVAGTTGDLSAYEQAMAAYGKEHKALDVAGTVIGMTVDPTTYIAGGVGSRAGKAATWAMGKLAAERGASKAVTAAATRRAASSLQGRLTTSMAASAGNLSTYEAAKEAERQMLYGGHFNDQGENEGYSLGAVASQAAHGAVMGTAIGWLSPVFGNVSDKLTRATESNLGKFATRSSLFAASTLAEGTIFAAPEIASALYEGDGAMAWDAWTDSQAMMLGFKGKHMGQTALKYLGTLARTPEGRFGLESRLRAALDAPSSPDLELTEDEKAELDKFGYDLKDLVSSDNATGAEDKEASNTVSRLQQMTKDPRVSEAARAKLYYYATGRALPMSAITNGKMYVDDKDGKETYIVNSLGANGVITSRRFTSRKAADMELQRIDRQAELNRINIGEQKLNDDMLVGLLNQACEHVGTQRDINPDIIRSIVNEASERSEADYNNDPPEVAASKKKIVDQVMEQYRKNLEESDSKQKWEIIRTNIGDIYAVDIDKALAKEPKRRTEDEQKAIDEYMKALYPNEPATEETSTATVEGVVLGPDGKPPIAGAGSGNQPQSPDGSTAGVETISPLDIQRNYAKAKAEAESLTDTNAYIPLEYRLRQAKEQGITDQESLDKIRAFHEAQAAWSDLSLRIMSSVSDESQRIATENTNQVIHADGQNVIAGTCFSNADGFFPGIGVYVTSGKVVVNADGSINKEASDKTVTIKTSPTGETHMIPVEELFSVEFRSIEDQTAIFQGEASSQLQRQRRLELGIDVDFKEGDIVSFYTGYDNNGRPTSPLLQGKVISKGNGFYRIECDGNEYRVIDFDLQSARIDQLGRQPQSTAEAPKTETPAAEPTAEPQPTISDSPLAVPPSGPGPGQPQPPTYGRGAIKLLNEDGSLSDYYLTGTIVTEDNYDSLGDPSLSKDDAGKYELCLQNEDKLIYVDPADLNNRLVSYHPDTKEQPAEPQQPPTTPQQPTTEAPAAEPPQQPTTEAPASEAPQQPAEPQQPPTAEAPASEPTAEPQPTISDSPLAVPPSGPGQQSPTEPPTEQQRAPMPMLKDKQGADTEEPDFVVAGADRAHQYMYEGESEMTPEQADRFVANRIAKLGEAQSKLKAPDEGVSIAKWRKAKADYDQKQAAIQAELDLWQQVQRKQQAILQQQAEAKATAEAEAQRKAAEAKGQIDQSLQDIPDFSSDRPENARARGYRKVADRRVDRQKPLTETGSVHIGKEVAVIFSKGVERKGNAAVIDISQLQGSHVARQRNPLHFISEAQPKERIDEVSQNEARGYAAAIRPDYITESVDAYSGAPNVNTRGEVIQGNNRTEALRIMYEEFPEQAAKYKQYLIDNAERLGIDAEAVANMEHPVYVNMFDVEDAEAIKLGHYTKSDTESGGKERIKIENAVGLMGNNMRAFADLLLRSDSDNESISSLIETNGADVLRWLNERKYISDTQYQYALDGKGNLTADAKTDLMEMLYSSVFQGAPAQLRQKFAAMPARAQRAILATAHRDFASPDGERMLAEVQDSIDAFYQMRSSNRAFAEATDLKTALAAIDNFKDQTVFNQEDGTTYTPSKKFSNFALTMAALYRTLTQKQIQRAYNDMYDLIQPPAQMTFADMDREPISMPEAVKKVVKDMFNIDIDYDGINGSNALDKPGETGQRGREGGTAGSASGERAAQGQGSALSGGGADSNGKGQLKPDTPASVAATPGEAPADPVNQPQSPDGSTAGDTPVTPKGKVYEAEQQVNITPTAAQAAAGNYKKGHVKVSGFNISIENPKGSERKGVDADGKPWSTTMNNTYGYIKGTEGVDGDHIDVFLGADTESWETKPDRKVFVVDQTNADGTFDEHKVMFGFADKDEAMNAYLSNYSADWAQKHPGLRITEVSIDDFNKWVQSSHRKTKPFADYSAVARKTDTPAGNLSTELKKLGLNDDMLATDKEHEDITGKVISEDGTLINEDGSTMVLYHGTETSDLTLDMLEPGHKRNDGDSAQFRGYGVASFTPDISEAEEYAEGGAILSARVTMKKPFIRFGTNSGWTADQAKRMTELLKAQGYDGIICYASRHAYDANQPIEVIPFDKRQIVPASEVDIEAAERKRVAQAEYDKTISGLRADIENYIDDWTSDDENVYDDPRLSLLTTEQAKRLQQRLDYLYDEIDGSYDGNYGKADVLKTIEEFYDEVLDPKVNAEHKEKIQQKIAAEQLTAERRNLAREVLDKNKKSGIADHMDTDMLERYADELAEVKRLDAVCDEAYRKSVRDRNDQTTAEYNTAQKAYINAHSTLEDKIQSELSKKLISSFTANGTDAAQALAEVKPKTVRADFKDFLAKDKDKKKTTPFTGGILHKDGRKTATDTRIILDIKANYDPTLEGKTVDSKGVEIKCDYPSVDRVFDGEKNPVNLDIKSTLAIAAKLTTDIAPDKKDGAATAYIAVGDRLYDAHRLAKVLQAADKYGLNNVSKRSGMLFFEGEKGRAAIMGLIPTNDNEWTPMYDTTTGRITGGKYIQPKTPTDNQPQSPDGSTVREPQRAYGRRANVTPEQKAIGRAVTSLLEDTGTPTVISAKAMRWALDKSNGSGRPLRTSDGEVFGMVKDGKIYINPETINPNTPVHEYTHAWDSALRKSNPKLWRRGKELLSQLPLWDEVKNDPNYRDIANDEDLLASEVHSRLTGEKGEEYLNQMVEQAKTKGDYIDLAKTVSLKQRIKQWLTDTLSWVRDAFSSWSDKDLRSLTLEEFRDMPIRDLAKGLNPADKLSASDMDAIHQGPAQMMFIGKRGAAKADAAATKADVVAEASARIDNLDKARQMEQQFGKESKERSASDRLRDRDDLLEDVIHKAKKAYDDGTEVVGLRFDSRDIAEGDEYGNSHQLYQDRDAFESTGADYPYMTDGPYKGYFDGGELNGTSAIHIEPDETVSSLKRKIESYPGKSASLIFGEDYEQGADDNEVVIPNAKVGKLIGTPQDDARRIKLATGWERGADGKWRYEIPDGRLIDNGGLELRRDSDGDGYFVGKLGDIWDSDELYSAYPQLRDLAVVVQNGGGGDIAAYFPGSKVSEPSLIIYSSYSKRALKEDAAARIEQIKQSAEYKAMDDVLEYAKNNPDSMPATERMQLIKEATKKFHDSELGKEYSQLMWGKGSHQTIRGLDEFYSSSVAHEIQHAIQHAEGFAPGTNTKAAKNYLRSKNEPVTDRSADDVYHRAMGEVESRNVEHRMSLTPEQRLSRLAVETEDVSRDDQIILSDAAQLMSMRPGRNRLSTSPSLFDTPEDRPGPLRSLFDTTTKEASKPQQEKKQDKKEQKKEQERTPLRQPTVRPGSVLPDKPMPDKPMSEEEKAETLSQITADHQEAMLSLEEGERTEQDLRRALSALDDMAQRIEKMYGADPEDEQASEAVTSLSNDMRTLRKEIYAKATEEPPTPRQSAINEAKAEHDTAQAPLTRRMEQWADQLNRELETLDQRLEDGDIDQDEHQRLSDEAYDRLFSSQEYRDHLDQLEQIEEAYSDRLKAIDTEHPEAEDNPEDTNQPQSPDGSTVRAEERAEGDFVSNDIPDTSLSVDEQPLEDTEWKAVNNSKMWEPGDKVTINDVGAAIWHASSKTSMTPKYGGGGGRFMTALYDRTPSGGLAINEEKVYSACQEAIIEKTRRINMLRSMRATEAARRSLDEFIAQEEAKIERLREIADDPSKAGDDNTGPLGQVLFRLMGDGNRTVVKETDVDGNREFEVMSDPDWNEVKDKQLIDKLESEPTKKLYAAMLLIDGKLYPPMSSMENKGTLRNPSVLGHWEESEERPDKIQKFKVNDKGEEVGVFELLKDNGDPVSAAYNPYFHQSDWPLNDQFSSAWKRDNIVVVEVEIPQSELAENGYRAKYAKDAVGLAKWKDGGLTKSMGGRQVYLSRWRKPVRILDDAEVAQMVAPKLKEHDKTVPFNVVPPSLRDALIKEGVKISEPEKGNSGDASRSEFERWSADHTEHIGPRNEAEKDKKAKLSAAKRLAKELHAPMTLCNSESDLAKTEIYQKADEETRRKMSASKGFFDPATGEVIINMHNHTDADDVVSTVLHENVAHKGLRQMIGEQRYDEFLTKVYDHATEEVRRRIAAKAADNGYNMRRATDEYLGDLATEKDFADFDKAERTIWGKVKRLIQEAINKFLVSLNLPANVRLGDNELKYILWRSRQQMRQSKPAPKEHSRPDVVSLAQDLTMRRRLKVGQDVLFRDGDNETKDIWDDHSVGMYERIVNAKIRLADLQKNNHDAANAAVRSIGGNLSDLRKAMMVQKNYDKTTVKRVTDLARILSQNGYLDVDNTTMNKILRTVADSAGATQAGLKTRVQQVMDIMSDSLLKRAERVHNSKLGTKAVKINDKGVEVQGELDIHGQNALKVYKAAIRMQERDLKQQIADTKSRLSDPSAPIAEQAADELQGLLLAERYLNDITASEAEEKDLRKEIEDARAEKAAGRMTAADFSQFKAATEDAIRQNRIERAEAFAALTGDLNDNLSDSAKRAQAWSEQQKQNIQRIHHMANSDMQGRPSDEHHQEGAADKIVNSQLTQFLLRPLGTFEQMFRVFGNKSANGEGYLWNHFVRGWHDCRDKELTGMRSKLEILDNKASEIFGRGVQWGDLIRNVSSKEGATVSFYDGGEMKEHKLTQGNLMYIYMADKMVDGRMKLRKMGITEDNVNAIAQALDPKLRQLADWLQDEFLVNTRNEYNETHKEVFGASMAAIENYFPIKILANARTDKEDDLNQQQQQQGITTTTGSIIKRRRNSLALDILNSDALSVLLDHVAQMEHWSAYAKWNKDLNALRTYKRFRNQLMNMTTAYGGGKELWQNFNKACLMAAGEYRPEVSKLDKTAVNLAKGATATKISLRTFTALKQLLSLPAFIPEVGIKEISKSLINPYGDFKWAMENLPIFRERWHSKIAGDPRLLKNDKDWAMWRNRYVQIAQRLGMTANAFVDAVTVSIGARAVYNTRLKQYTKEGYSQADAERRARQDAVIAFNQTQQSSEAPFLSTMQVDHTWASTIWTVFRNASMSYTRQEFDALRNLGRNLQPGQRDKSVAFTAKQILRDWGVEENTATPEQLRKAKAAAESRWNRQMRKDGLRLATFGYIVQMLWNMATYLPYTLFGNDKDDKKKTFVDAASHALFGSIEGLTGGDVLSNIGNMALSGEFSRKALTKDMPLMSDVNNAIDKFVGGKNREAINDIINIVVATGTGLNPQAITDAVVATIDACGDDPKLAHGAAILIMRWLQVPQSQLDKLYFDDLGLSGEETKGYTPRQLAERYARYQVMRGAPLMPWTWGDEAANDSKQSSAYSKMRDRLDNSGDAATIKAYNEFADLAKDYKKRTQKYKELSKTDYGKAKGLMTSMTHEPGFYTYRVFEAQNKTLDLLAKACLNTDDKRTSAAAAKAIPRYRKAMVRLLQAEGPNTRRSAMEQLQSVLDDFNTECTAQ